MLSAVGGSGLCFEQIKKVFLVKITRERKGQVALGDVQPLESADLLARVQRVWS